MPHVIEYAKDTARLEISLDSDGNVLIEAAPKPYTNPAKVYFRLTPDEAASLAATIEELLDD